MVIRRLENFLRQPDKKICVKSDDFDKNWEGVNVIHVLVGINVIQRLGESG